MTHTERIREPRRPASARAPSGPRTDPLRRHAACPEGSAGSVEFHLQRVTGGLYVEREDTPRRGLRTIQSIVFCNPASFERWCDADPIRFEHPLLHARLKRAGGELWDTAPGAGAD